MTEKDITIVLPEGVELDNQEKLLGETFKCLGGLTRPVSDKTWTTYS
jgi:hypothetical protein